MYKQVIIAAFFIGAAMLNGPSVQAQSHLLPGLPDAEATGEGFSPELKQAIADGAQIPLWEVDSFVEKQRQRIDLTEKLQLEYPHTLSGVWMDDNQNLHVSAKSEDVLNSAKKDMPHLETHLVKYSYEELMAIQDRVTEYYSTVDTGEGAFVSINSETNKIEVAQGNGSEAVSAQYSMVIPEELNDLSDAIQFTQDEGESTLLDCRNGWDCFPYLRGGMFIQTPSGGNCTAGFTARNKKGEKYILTAGHCGHRGGIIRTGIGANTPVGIMTNATNNKVSDSARVFVSDPAWKMTRWVRMDDRRQAMAITGKLGQSMSKNQLVCKSGQRTGLTCGKVTHERINFTVEGKKREGFWRTSIRSMKGDSGAPVFVPYNASQNASRAFGILSSGDQRTYTDGPGIYTVESAENVSIVTR